MTAVSIDMTQVKLLARDLQRAGVNLTPQFTQKLRAAGDLVAEQARKDIEPFSTRIPGSIRVSARGFNVSVIAGDDNAPHAAAFDNLGVPGMFRHPVFGDTTLWVDQPAHPFLEPAFEEKFTEVDNLVVQAIDVTFYGAGWHG